MSRLKERYQKEVVPALRKEFGYKNVMAVPKIEKVVVNMGLGEATSNAKIIDTGADELARITGQKPVTRKAKKSIAQFKVRKGQSIATMVTLRGARMWEFLDRLIGVAILVVSLLALIVVEERNVLVTHRTVLGRRVRVGVGG